MKESNEFSKYREKNALEMKIRPFLANHLIIMNKNGKLVNNSGERVQHLPILGSGPIHAHEGHI